MDAEEARFLERAKELVVRGAAMDLATAIIVLRNSEAKREADRYGAQSQRSHDPGDRQG